MDALALPFLAVTLLGAIVILATTIYSEPRQSESPPQDPIPTMGEMRRRARKQKKLAERTGAGLSQLDKS